MEKYFKERILYCTMMIKHANSCLDKSLKGKLKVSKNKCGYYFYQVIDGKKQYLRKENKEQIKKLAQNDYYFKVIKIAERQKKFLEHFCNSFKPNELDEYYSKLNPCRKAMINPYNPINIYIEKWKAVKYQRKKINIDQVAFLTRNKEFVRSKSEVIIADTLDKLGIPYRYEYPLYLENYQLFPDFTVLNIKTGKEFIFEHFGMLGEQNYDKNLNLKLELYSRNGYFFGENLLYTFETKNAPLNTLYLEKLLEHFLLN